MCRAVVLALLVGCSAPAPDVEYVPPQDPGPSALVQAPGDPIKIGRRDNHLVDFDFEGGQIEFDLYSAGTRIVQTARNRYAVPVQIAWSISPESNLLGGVQRGTAYLPPAANPDGFGPEVVLVELVRPEPSAPYFRDLRFRARFGDPRARPFEYDYALPYPTGYTFTVLQGFHGEFSHRGSNEYAVDFDCPVATPVLAARDGVVVVTNAAALGSGTKPEFLDYKRTNFVIIQHDDGTLGEYMHLAPSSVIVRPGERVARRKQLALSGNTGYSSTPHLHFQVMTASADGIAAMSFPFRVAASPTLVEEPIQGRRYAAWE